METLSTKVPEPLLEEIEAYADDKHDGVKSQAIRDLIRKGLDYDDLEARTDDLQRQLRETNRYQNEVGELVEYVEEERELMQERMDRRGAPVWRRARWWVFGRD